MKYLEAAQIRTVNRNSSKGNQLKWYADGLWYKADYTGYEGLAEYVVSQLLACSSIADTAGFVQYGTEEIVYEGRRFLGCCSQNFLPPQWEIVTLEHLFRNVQGKALYKEVLKFDACADRIRYTVEETERMTGLKGFGAYLTTLLELDAFFLNEDRHTNNIALLRDPEGSFHYCPVFDNGASLLSDTALDYPLDADLYALQSRVKAKPFSPSFEEQADSAEQLYGQQLYMQFTAKEVEHILKEEQLYPAAIHERVEELLRQQMRKYPYLFKR